MSEIRFPNITARDETGQLQQVKSYLYQLVEQLNWALSTVEATESKQSIETVSGSTQGDTSPEETFNSIKALIIKSADIVNAYYEQINERLEGVYVAESDFGTYSQNTSAEIQKNSTSIAEMYTNIQNITSSLAEIGNSTNSVTACIKSGLLYEQDGIPVYGVEIGQRTEIDGKEVFNKYARFISDRLSFYDRNGTEVAYISDKKLYITNVEVTGSFLMGGFVDTVRADKSIVTKWVGG